ncbi:maleylacetate reductase [Streptomyces mexicanus]|uniref:maleylacetate reductase n=1 Tax=Streptomyces mexicanus TaxID=178566 RepID=UPI0036635692
MSLNFVHTMHPARVVFGEGRRRDIPSEADRLGLRRLLILSTPQRRQTVAEITSALGERVRELYPHAAMHVPARTVAKAVRRARELEVDGCVAIGGGSSIGLGKAIAKETGLPSIAVPTTYSGSEMTPIWGITEANQKITGRDIRALPVSVVYDPELTLSLPPQMSVTSGVNAMAHACEALYAPDVSPITAVIAAEAVRALGSALPLIVAAPADPVPRSGALYGAWLAGTCLGATSMSLHHKLCHILGGTFDLPHAPTHAVLLPYVLAYNLPAAPAAAAALCGALGCDDPVAAVQTMTGSMGAASSLRELGLPKEGIEAVVEQAMSQPYANPREVDRGELHVLLHAAFEGAPASLVTDA